MEAVIDIDSKSLDNIEEPQATVTELTVLQPRQTSSFERRMKHLNIENGGHDRTSPIQCEVVNWSLSGYDDTEKESLNIQISKSPRSTLKRNRTMENDAVENDFLKSPHKLRNLSVDEISKCLKAIGLDSCVDTFHNEGIDGEQFVYLDEDILLELDVEKEKDREKILNLVKEGVILPQT